MKIGVYCDELYPYYGLCKPEGIGPDGTIELTDEQYADLINTFDRFDRWQKKLEKLLKK